MTQNADGSWKVVDLRTGSPDGTDTLKNIDFLQFSDTTVAVGTVQPPPPPPVVQVPVISAVTPDTQTPPTASPAPKSSRSPARRWPMDGQGLRRREAARQHGRRRKRQLEFRHHRADRRQPQLHRDGDRYVRQHQLGLGATNVIVDTAAPVTPTIALQSVDSGVAGDNITNVKVVSLTGVAEINSTITVNDGATVLGSAVANAEGVWNLASI